MVQRALNNKRQSVTRTWSLALGVMFSLTLAVSIAYVVTVQRLSAVAASAANETAVRLQLTGKLKEQTAILRFAQRGVVLFTSDNDSANATQERNRYERALADIKKTGAEYGRAAESEVGRKAVAVFTEEVERYSRFFEDVDSAAKAHNVHLALDVIVNRARPVANTMTAALEQLVELEQRQLKATLSEIAFHRTQANVIAAAACCLSVVISGIVFIFLRRSTAGLKKLAGELNDGAARVANAASQVSSTSQSLAQGASQQAASLEETSASTEEINAMAKKNADACSMATELVGETQEKFAHTNASLDLMVQAMGEITTSSEKISKIIQVIDEIAFQTNILALNAAVEAARAGDAGAGFAVVAEEVRNLAHRSAKAAKDTAVLIQETISKSHDGSVKVGQAAVATRDVTAAASQIKTLVEAVNGASQEQSRGIEQIGKAVSHMDQLTQSTAAAAEQGASAAQELTAESKTLKAIVAELAEIVS